MIITIDKGIQLPGPGKVSLNERYGAQLRSMDIGDSFFMEGISSTDAELVAIMTFAERKLGVRMLAQDMDEDEVYLEAGVRVWRVSAPSAGTTVTQQTEAPAVTVAKSDNKRRYWMLESDDFSKYSAWSSSQSLDKQGICADAQARAVEITAEQFDAIDQGNYTLAYWIDRSTGSWATDVVGISPPRDRTGWEQVDLATYTAFLGAKQPPRTPTSGDGFLYVRNKVTGNCRKVKVEGLSASQIEQLDKECEPIEKAEYDKWESDNEL